MEVSSKAPDTSQSSAVAHFKSSEQIRTRCDRRRFLWWDSDSAACCRVCTLETVCQIIHQSLGAQIGARHFNSWIRACQSGSNFRGGAAVEKGRTRCELWVFSEGDEQPFECRIKVRKETESVEAEPEVLPSLNSFFYPFILLHYQRAESC